MSKQREKPGLTKERLEKGFGHEISDETLFSGGMIENFRKGWAMPVFSGEKGHYFKRHLLNIAYAKSACGIIVGVRQLYGIGNFPKCKRCARTIKSKEAA